MKTKSKIWIAGYFILVAGALGIAGGWVVKVDPFFHYHKPNTAKYFYTLDNQRNLNDGIIKHFDYDALITGTSMTENFRTTEMNSVFGVNSIKVPFAGGTYKEINDNLAKALACNPGLTTVVRGLDMEYFFDHKDRIRDDLGEYPTYLYDDNIFNDIEYVFNRDIIFRRVYSMLKENDMPGFVPGVSSFDNYSYWMGGYSFGGNTVRSFQTVFEEPGTPVHMTEEERQTIHENIEQNVVSLAREYPDTTFYYFFTPYSAAWWEARVADGTIYKQIEAEEYIIEQILECENIKLYSFNNRTDITTDLNNYKDLTHYGVWINSLILKWMQDGQYILTKENYADYLAQELSFYTSYDYSLLQGQTDYENDYFAEALLRKELAGTEPLVLLPGKPDGYELENAEIVEDQSGNVLEVNCQGNLQRTPDSAVAASDYLINSGYAGIKMTIEEIAPYKYLVFYGEKNRDHGQPGVFVYNENNEAVAELTVMYYQIDEEEHQYMLDVSRLTGRVTVIFNGAYTDTNGSKDSSYTFRDVTLY